MWKLIEYHKYIIIQRVTFHNSSIRPLVDEYGHNIQPSTSINFALEAVSDLETNIENKIHKYLYDFSMQGIFTRLESPYETDCYQSWSQTNYSTQFLNSTNWPYSFMVGFGSQWYKSLSLHIFSICCSNVSGSVCWTPWCRTVTVSTHCTWTLTTPDTASPPATSATAWLSPASRRWWASSPGSWGRVPVSRPATRHSTPPQCPQHSGQPSCTRQVIAWQK